MPSPISKYCDTPLYPLSPQSLWYCNLSTYFYYNLIKYLLCQYQKFLLKISGETLTLNLICIYIGVLKILRYGGKLTLDFPYGFHVFVFGYIEEVSFLMIILSLTLLFSTVT